ncbi:hypothetical protein [Cupriavidus oxalaticus]|uniref:hypothetical protein n=1 Tax=Cupriavidus oxalaticus TaxID=96344 RepID=UPI001247496C|nr:hypothetical protein [Cupriavidus oxalaticus]
MVTRSLRFKKLVAASVLLPFASILCQAQESANADLDSCVVQEQTILTAKGAGLGVVAGLGAALFGKNKDDSIKKAAIGAAVGGAVGAAAGFATAYYTAIDTCYKKNPSWIPESKIERTKDYARVKKEIRYDPKRDGAKTLVSKIDMPATAKAGDKIDMASRFIAMTPDGSEANVAFERKLTVIEDGKETLLPFPGKVKEDRTVEPGENMETSRLPIPAEAKSGTQYRYEFAVSMAGKPASVAAQTVTVQ